VLSPRRRLLGSRSTDDSACRRGCRNTIQLITAFRHNDQVFAVMPYQPNDDYRVSKDWNYA
jgi:hypothetical protein